MSSVKSMIVRFPASPSPDVVGYRLYVEESPTPVSVESQMFDLGDVTEIDISALDGMLTKNGIYNIGVTAVDAAEGESSLSILEGVAIDFVAPDPPGQIVVERS